MKARFYKWFFILLIFILYCLSPSYAGQLKFDGVPVDITTTDNEDLVIAPGAGGNTQIGIGTATNSYAVSQNDLFISGILESAGAGYFDSTFTVTGALTANGSVTLGDSASDKITPIGRLSANLLPEVDSTYSLGSSKLAFSNLYVNNVSGYISDLNLSPASGYSLKGMVIKDASSGDEVAYDLSVTVNKSASGNYSGLKLNATETSAPGSANKLLDLQVGGESRLQAYNGVNSANYGLLSLGSGAWDGESSGYFSGSSDGTILAVNTLTGFSGNFFDLQSAGSSVFQVDSSGNVIAVGSQSYSGNMLIGGNLAVNGGSITTTAPVFNFLNTVANTINFGGAASSISMGAATGITTLNNSLTVKNNTILGDASADIVTFNAGTLNLINAANLSLPVSASALNIASGLLSMDTDNSRLGVGTITPGTTLDVAGTGRFASLLTASNGLTLTAGALNLSADSGSVSLSGLSGASISTGANPILLASGGSSNWTNTAGDLTIGTFSSGRLNLDSAGLLTIGTDTQTSLTLGRAGAGTVINGATLTVGPTAWTAEPTISGLITAASGLTLSANKDLTFTSGTGVYRQTFSGTDSDALSIGADALTSGSAVEISSGSTAAVNGNALVNLAVSGTNAAEGVTRYALRAANTAAGTGSTNVGGYFSASGAANNYGLIVESGNVGVGTASPAYKLDVAGDIKASGTIYGDLAQGTVTPTGFELGSVVFAGAGGTLAQNNANLFWDNTNLELGIGTASPSAKLEIKSSAVTDINLKLKGVAGQTASLFSVVDSSDSELLTLTAAGNLGVGTNAPSARLQVLGADSLATSFAANISGATGTGLVVRNDGNVGIGTTNPVYPLDVTGAIRSTSYMLGASFLSSTGVFYTTSSDLNIEAGNSAGQTRNIIFQTNNGGTIGEVARISSAGNVGIGTAAPASELHVNSVKTIEGQGALMRLFAPSMTDNNAIGIYLGKSAEIDTSGTIGFVPTTTAASSYLQLGLYGSAGPLVIGKSNVGIGTTSPAYKLDVSGDIRATGTIYGASGTQVPIGTGTTNYLPKWSASGTLGNSLVYDDGTNVGISQTSPTYKLDIAGDIRSTTGAYFATSSGNVGVGTSAPGQQLEITKAFKIPDTIDSTTGVIYKGAVPFMHNFKALGVNGNNLFIGKDAGNFTMGYVYSEFDASNNVAIGDMAFSSNTAGGDNVAVGYKTLFSNTEGRSNVAVGANALFHNTTGWSNTAIGNVALYGNTEGYGNVSLGDYSLSSNVSGNENVALGRNALVNGVSASSNVSIGLKSLNEHLSGNYNIAIGENSAYYDQTGGWNTFMGAESGYGTSNRTGANYNVSVGYKSGHSIATNQTRSVFLGPYSGYYETDSNVLMIDNLQRASKADAKTKALIYGIFNAATASQYLTVNGQLQVAGTGNSYISGNVGIGATSPAYKLDVSGDIRATGTIYGASGAQVPVGTGTENYLSKWSAGGTLGDSVIYDNGTKVGIGIVEPTYLFHVGDTDTSFAANIADALYVDSANNKVGVGLRTDPNSYDNLFTVGKIADRFTYIDIKSSDWGGIHFKNVNGSTTIGAIVYAHGDGHFEFSTNGGEKMRISGTGNVGIGTTSPTGPLQVHSTGTYVNARFTDAVTGATVNDGIAFGYDDSYGGIIWNREASNIVFATSNAEKVRIDSTGNVGIGTAAPGSKLDIHENSNADTELRIMGQASYDPRIYLKSEEADTEGFKFWYDNSVGDTYFDNIYSQATQTLPAIRFRTNVNGTTNALVNAMTIVHSGNVGIGTTEPSYPLHLYKAASETGILLGWGANSVYLSHGGWSMGAGKFGIGNGTTPSIVVNSINNNVGIGTTAPGGMLDIVKTHAAATAQEMFRMAFDANWHLRLVQNYVGAGDIHYEFKEKYSGTEYDVMAFKGGNVGIGTTSPTAKLEVAGQIVSTKFALTDGATIAINWDNANVQSVTLGGSRTVSFSNAKSGGVYTLMFTQDATGSRVITWSGNWKWPGGVAPVLTTTASARDIFTFVSDGTNLYNIGFAADVK